jgi:hypothetical protein
MPLPLFVQFPETVSLLPVIEQEETLETLQKSLEVLPLGSREGCASRCPVWPLPWLNCGVGSRQTEEPEEQKEGEMQVVLVVALVQSARRVVEAMVWVSGQLQAEEIVQEQEAWE